MRLSSVPYLSLLALAVPVFAQNFRIRSQSNQVPNQDNTLCRSAPGPEDQPPQLFIGTCDPTDSSWTIVPVGFNRHFFRASDVETCGRWACIFFDENGQDNPLTLSSQPTNFFVNATTVTLPDTDLVWTIEDHGEEINIYLRLSDGTPEQDFAFEQLSS